MLQLHISQRVTPNSYILYDFIIFYMILSDFYIILYDFIGFWMDFDDFFMNRSAYTSPEINMFKMCAARGQRLREGTAHILNMLISEVRWQKVIKFIVFYSI